MAVVANKRWGSIEVQDSIFVWRPSAEIKSHVQKGLELRFDCLDPGIGLRQFAPVGGSYALLLNCAPVGTAILKSLGRLSPEQLSTYRSARFLFQQAPRYQEFFSRRFLREADLGGGILPGQLGVGAGGKGRPWSASRLMAEGREEASARGAKPSQENWISLGLLRAAQGNPIDLSSLSKKECRKVIQAALFGSGEGAPVTKKQMDIVQNRLLNLLERQSQRDTEHKAFCAWLFNDVSNIVHQIAKAVKDGGPLPREVVRSALVQIAFDVHLHISDCTALTMQAFRQALPKPLSRLERKRFDALYSPQRWLGGFTPLVLLERFSFLQEAFGDIWVHQGEPERTGALLRLLDYYREMVTNRRSTDSARKKRRGLRNRGSERLGDTYQGLNVHGDAAQLSAEAQLFQDTASHFRGDRTCRCGRSGRWTAALIPDDNSPVEGEELVRFNHCCNSCGRMEQHEVSRAEFVRVATGLHLAD